MKIGELKAENQKRRNQHKTNGNYIQMFPIGSRVRIVCIEQDGYPFHGDETGTVEPNEESRLAQEIFSEHGEVYFDQTDDGTPENEPIITNKVKVKFDAPRNIKENDETFLQESFAFDPINLILLKEEEPKEKEPDNIIEIISTDKKDIEKIQNDVKIENFEYVISFQADKNNVKGIISIINSALMVCSKYSNFKIHDSKINKKEK